MRKVRWDGKILDSIMPRPENAQDVLDLIHQSGLVGEAALAHFTSKLTQTETRDGLLGLMVAEGLLTRYQAAELIGGEWRGLRLGGYRILDRIGNGGMSQVYLAEHVVLGKRVAVKVLSVSLRADKAARRRFVREARAASAIEHPNIVHVFDVDMDHDPPYLVMEYVDGISLQAAVADYGTFTGEEAAAVGCEIARGLAVAASVGLVHRDIKPANLLLDRRGGVKILDLGIIRLLGDDTHPPGYEAEEILGTLDYLAPEQAENSANVDARADLYALGATLYFLLAGHPPFPGTDPRHKLAAKQFSDPPPIHRLRPDVDPGLSRVIHTLLVRDVAGRCQSATDAVVSLSPFASLTADFPKRYFRLLSSSAEKEGVKIHRDLSLVSPTESIRKPAFRVAVATPQPQTQTQSLTVDEVDDSGPPTVRLSKALTDMVMDALLEVPPTPLKEAQETSIEPSATGRAWWMTGWTLFAIAAVVVIAVIAWVWLG